MGWSATALACQVLDTILARCEIAGNVWEHNGKRYFLETGKEHVDGHISGRIMLMCTDNGTPSKDGGYCKRVGALYIEPDGTVRHATHGLREMVK